MWVAVLRLDVAIPGARSRKDRRQAVKSLKERLGSRFNVSCAEVDDQQSWVRASLGIAACGNEKSSMEEKADAIARYAAHDAGVMLGRVKRDVFRFEDDSLDIRD